MAVNKTQYRLAGDTNGGPSPAVWSDCPIDEFMYLGTGYHWHDDFLEQLNTDIDGTATYFSYLSTGATIVSSEELGGGLTIASDGDDEGTGIQGQTNYNLTKFGEDLWFEARVKASTIADTKSGIFLGLMDTTALTAIVPITAGGALADANMVGFWRDEDDGDSIDTVYKANGVTAVTVKADAVALVADTFIKLGMKYTKADATLRFYADGTLLSGTKVLPDATGTDFPADVNLGLLFATVNATASTPGSATIDWWRIAQARA